MPLIAYNQVEVPSFMYGTAWKKAATVKLVELAVRTGFRAIDTANQLIHYDEALVGEALLQVLERQGVQRDSLFLQTKFTPLSGHDHRTPYDPSADLTAQVAQSFNSSLEHLHTDYLDSYVLHAPISRRGLGAADWEVWAAMENLYESGKTKMIGISNITAPQLQLLCAQAKHRPMVVQNRCFAVLVWDRDVREICRENDIIYEGFSLLTANGEVLASRLVRGVAQRLGATPAQVIFRFAMQIGMLPLTGTTSRQHMQEDLDSERLQISDEEVAAIEMIAV
jgi:diketogulonate reductase-like aldo/keto reductase